MLARSAIIYIVCFYKNMFKKIDKCLYFFSASICIA